MGIACVLILTAMRAEAAEQRYQLVLDTDNNAATGCVVSVGASSAAGVEQVLTAVVNTTTTGVNVVRLERQTCTGGVLGAPVAYSAGGWVVGLGNGVGGSAVTETYVPLSSLPTGTLRAWGLGIDSNGAADWTSPFLLTVAASGPGPGATPVPLSGWLVLPLGLVLFGIALWWQRRHPASTAMVAFVALAAAAGVAWAGTVILDGNVSDWLGIQPAVTDPQGDAPPNADIVAVYYQQDAQNLYLRFDTGVRPDAPGNQAPVVNAGPDQTITLPAVANLVGTASDDGLPNPPGVLTTTWSIASGPGSVMFGNVHALSTTATFSIAGSYVLRLTASDGALSTSSTLTITVNNVVGAGPQLAPIPDRTIALGTRFQQLLQATSANANETLTFALPTAPAGAALSPPPLIDWTPIASQVGPNTFTAKVTDSQGRTATASFNVTVTHVNQPPQLAPQADETVRIGTTFTRTLKATDPDAGDTMSFGLVAGPPGMVLNGATLTWATGSIAVGDYTVTIKVTDSGGLFDTKSFTIKLLSVVLPVAIDDNYSVRLGETLTVPAPGVLLNDLASGGASLSAVKITNPDKGTLNIFNADGSFTFTAPPVVTGPVFAPTLKWNNGLAFWNGTANPVVADVFANGKPVVFASRTISEGGVIAIDGAAGTTLWNVTGELPAPNAGCFIQNDITPQNQTADRFAVGDIDDSGVPAIVASAKCLADGAQGTRMVALNARTGTVKWLTPPLGAFITNSNGFNFYFNMTYGITPVIARLHPAETPSVLFKVDAESYLDNANTQRSCDQFQANSGLNLCTGVLALNGADGSVRHRYIAPNDDAGRENFAGGHLMVADLTGTGTLNLIANGAVWDVDGNLISNRLGGVRHRSIALAKLDDSGQISIISYEVGGGYVSFIVARHADGTVQWQTPIDATTVHGHLSVADLDGDGSPEIMATAEGNLYVYDAKGQIKWTHRYADASNLRTIDEGKRPAAFDLDGDGIAEVIIPTTFGVEFTDGATGKTKKTLTWADLGVTSTGYGGGYAPTFSTSAVVADIDGSGHASIIISVPSVVFGASQYVVAIGATNNDWRSAPTVLNQFTYHVTNVDNVGHIPTVETNAFATPRTNVFGNQAQKSIPVDPRVHQGTTFTYAASNGIQTSQPATVTIDIWPQNRPPVFTSVPPTAYVPFTLTYAAHATDPDPGDRVTYSLLLASGNGAAGCSVDAISGLVVCPSLNAGDQFFTIVATDTQGASAYQSVHLTQSAGPATVPNVVGQSKSGADATLTAAGFVTGNVSSIYYAAPANQVLTQFPAGGSTALAGSAIALQISLGPQPQAVPDLIGLQLSVARTRLAGIGFGIIVIPVASATAPAGEVVAQNPVFGTVLAPPSPVTVSVSTGPPLTGEVAQVIVQPAPTALRVTGESLNFTATAVFTDGTSADVTIASLWDTSAPAVASVDSTGGAKALTPGVSTISAKAGGVTGQSALTVVARNTGDNVTPVAQITSPADGASVSGPTVVSGTAADANFLRYELAVAPAGDMTWTLINEGTTPVTAGTLGTFDPTTLVNDLYTLRLTVFDRNSNQTVASSTVQVTGAQKPGLFTLSYQDLALPAAGIPITVTRTYDSRDKAKGDFGIGWRLGFQTLRLRANRVPGTGWIRTNSGATVILNPTSEHKVSVTLPDGKVEEFDLVVSPTSNLGGLDATVVTGYVPRSGTLGKLQMLDNPNLLILNGGTEDELVDDSTLNAYNPVHYRYTLQDGTQFEYSQLAGVTKISDPNGNSVTFGPGGIIHSSGKSVVFARDSQSRITQITDPVGNVQIYSYDANGNLSGHSDATGAASHYRYDYQHKLIDVQDPTGNHAVRNEYDTTGHLTATIDANGQRVTYANDPGTQTDIVTDRRGVITQIQYDAMGNVTSSQTGVTIEGSLVLAKTTKTYDALGNETSVVDPDGARTASTFSGLQPLTQVVDPTGLNLTTTLVYNAQTDPTLVTDAAGKPYTLAYDINRNVTGINMPMQGPVTAVFNGQGQVASRIDALGTKTAYTYDASGNVIREDVLSATSTLLRRTDAAYDANGNKQSETRYRTIGGTLTPLMTQYAYDATSRLVAVTDSLGNIARTEYDANGHVGAEVDALGRRTTYAYDAVGRLSQTTMPDGTKQARTYDVSGNLATQTDLAGRTTAYAYDELNRNVRLTLADGSFTQTVYSPGGLMTATIDANGNRTDYAYDAAGRRTVTTLPAVANGPGGPLVRPQIASAVNALGAPVSIADPNGHVTTLQYDSNGRLAQTTYPDGTKVQQTHDALGRLASVTNEEGQTTTFSYDGLGRLISVAGLAGDASYAYDEAGNLIAQTDALGRVTQFGYDAINRMVQRQYPGGETEKFVYDALGNLIARTDGLGRTTSIAYDAMNRAVSKTMPGGVTVANTYKPDGQRATVTDPRGVTTYGYDSLGRLASVTHPTGETVNYSRDSNDNLLSLASPAATVNYAYDAVGRLIQVSAPEGASRSYYDLAGNRLRQQAANGMVTDATFDVRNRPVSLSHKTSGGTLLQSYASVYSPSGRRTQVTESDSSAEVYAYDAKGRLAAETRTGTNPLNITHSYDAVGNRLQTVNGGASTTFTYDSDDRVLGDGNATYGWDANGNLVSRTQGAAVTQYGYDAENRLVSIAGTGIADQYTYDYDGNRVKAVTAAGTTRFLVDTNNNTGLSQVLEETDGGGALQARYSYGKESLAMVRGAAPSFSLRDIFGSARGLTNAAGAITDTYQYDAFGNTVSANGSTVNPYRYRGERLDVDSGFYQLRARYFSPTHGRFMTRDPLPGQVEAPASRHRYAYADDDPVNKMDPTGKESLIELSVRMAIDNGLNAVKTVNDVQVRCAQYQNISIIGDAIMWGSVAVGIVGASAQLTTLGNHGVKSSWSVVGLNPVAFGSKSIKKAEFQQEFPFAAKLSLTEVSNLNATLTFSNKGFSFNFGKPLYTATYKACFIDVGKFDLNAKAYPGNPDPTFKLTAALSALGIFKLEWELLEATVPLSVLIKDTLR